MAEMHETKNDLLDQSIKFVRMQSGDDLVTELVHIKNETEEYYQLINPLKIVYMLSQRSGSISLSLVEWIFPRICEGQEFQIYPSDIVTVAQCTTDLIDYYYEALYKFSQSRDNVDFGKVPEKQKKAAKEERVEFEDIELPTDEEVEYIKKVLDDLAKTKRVLH